MSDVVASFESHLPTYLLRLFSIFLNECKSLNSVQEKTTRTDAS